jgi:hypothetical protein
LMKNHPSTKDINDARQQYNHKMANSDEWKAKMKKNYDKFHVIPVEQLVRVRGSKRNEDAEDDDDYYQESARGLGKLLEHITTHRKELSNDTAKKSNSWLDLVDLDDDRPFIVLAETKPKIMVRSFTIFKFTCLLLPGNYPPTRTKGKNCRVSSTSDHKTDQHARNPGGNHQYDTKSHSHIDIKRTSTLV